LLCKFGNESVIREIVGCIMQKMLKNVGYSMQNMYIFVGSIMLIMPFDAI